MLPRVDDPSECSSMVHRRTHCRTAERSTRQDRGTVYLLRRSARTADHCNVGKVTIDMLPEEILLEVFAVYTCIVEESYEWETLVHVCRRWRSIVFAAPRRLDLQLVCTCWTPAREMLYIWPALPIFLYLEELDEIDDDVLAALEKRDRICEVSANRVSQLEELVGAMQVTFPALTNLLIYSFEDNDIAPLSESFLGGSAPNLRSFFLVYLAFPALPNLLLSSPDLVSLSLTGIPDSGYISPDTMADCLSPLTRLETLQISFQTPRPCPNRAGQCPPPLARTVFPVLSTLHLGGVTEYLEQILAYIEAPLLDSVDIRFYNPPIFEIFISRIVPYIGRTGTFEAFDQAYMSFLHDASLEVVLSSRKGTTGGKMLTLSLQWNDSGWKLRELTYDPPLGPFNLRVIERRGFLPMWAEDMANAPWLHLVRFFPATEYMYLARGPAVYVAPALQELTGAGVREVLPMLRNIFVERLDSLGPVQEAIGQFVAARQLLSGHPIDVQCWVE